MHPAEIRHEALRLIAQGANDCEVARSLGIARTTVREWRRPSYVPRLDRAICPRCWKPAKPTWFTSSDYAELLGLYLGDGCISRMGRSYSFRISLDAKYPAIIDRTEELVRGCMPATKVYRVRPGSDTWVVLAFYSNHLPCLFPQHGPGKKHERRILLEPWQQEHVTNAPWALLRGLIWSDGCVYTNRTGKYEYLSYAFFNSSSDLLDLFASTCDLVGVERRRNAKAVRIYRRAAVERFVAEVGFKT